ncbi:hypothetical protein AMTR_s00080p00131040 [Amborella trichopoda]|uniref:Protein kinase domain-containing protein n=2 Tax=Amborella trichopoda TaxID=13333 RepID=W1PAH5_AMBTC|nr:hypothetical protein AMTR_s00080p00131040 [Amborella trichopoda]
MAKTIREAGSFLLLFGVVFLFSLSTRSLSFTPVDNYLIDCGSSANTTIDGRVFVADDRNSFDVIAPSDILASTSLNSLSSALYSTARVLTGPSSYSFSIQKQGYHWIRLYFFPFVAQNYNLKTAIFTVSAEKIVLLQDFQPPSDSSILKEYLINVTSDRLVLTFRPSIQSPLAFINAIEVISAPDELIHASARTVLPVGSFNTLSEQAFETMFRVNIGGPMVTPANDTLGRTWIPDQGFLLEKSTAKSKSFTGNLNYRRGGATQDTAPDAVYSTAEEMNSANVANTNFNITWNFTVDPNFTYFLRMHFCDIVSTALNLLYFNVYIGDWSASRDLDLSALTSSLASPYFIDFVTPVTDKSSSSMRVSIGPSSIPGVDPNAILNGLEIMKMNNSVGSLDGLFAANPSLVIGSKGKVGLILGLALGSSALVLLLILGLLFCKRRSMKLKKHQSKSWIPFSVNGANSHSTVSKFSNATTVSSGLNSSLGFRFSFAEIQEATNNFDENWVIGVGGFGKVYKGTLRDGTQVAVKRGNPRSQQGLTEFQTEIEMLSKFRHRHLVSLIGYCDERNEMILVYEYMANGTLKNHLYGSELPPLSWKQRLEICIGSARGLHYLHTGSAQGIIHRDVKSANILLDENLMAKVADFGLSKTGPDLDQTHVSTAVKGSFGYLDPEYFRRQQLTEKSDVYSFGVVMLEVLCARPVIDPTLPREKVNLAEWAMKWQKKGQLDQIIDLRLVGQISADSLRKFGETADKCLAEYGVDRPTMGDVLWNLEYALQLQETAMRSEPDEDSTNRIAELPLRITQLGASEENDEGREGYGSAGPADDLSDVSTSKVFSQLFSTEGR